ncbi:MAG: hypothetical protein EHM42_01585 [Planctomycetaceae bacterium]|nr:MAG: hypothetical protein EHM42_01585 [Planctomycetaceae bacterium]
MKAYRPPPIPRELSARITIPSDFPPGVVRWQVANANGTSQTGVFLVGDGREVVENRDGAAPQRIETLPATVSGRLARFEEVDCYEFLCERDSLVTCDLAARRLGSNFMGAIEIRDAQDRVIVDAVDTQGTDASLTFPTAAGNVYRAFVRDLNFRGNRASVYRLALTTGPRVLAAYPAAGRRGSTTGVELVGYGLTSGRWELERVKRTIEFPALTHEPVFDYQFTSESGETARFRFPLSDLPEFIETAAIPRGAATDGVPSDGDPSHSRARLEAPLAITGRLDRVNPSDRYQILGRGGELWRIAVQARAIGSPLDVALAIIDSDGKELATSDDSPGSTDASLEIALPRDGVFELVVSEVSGAAPSPLGLYRLVVERATPDFLLEMPQHINVPTGGQVELPVKAHRTGGFQGAIALNVSELPAGIQLAGPAVIEADQAECKLSLVSAPDAATGASLATVTGIAMLDGRSQTRTARAQAAGNLTPRSLEDLAVDSILIASTLKPVARIRPLETDERTAHRGTMHLAELEIERLDGFSGEVVVQMDSRQPVKFRQGIVGPDIVVPAGVNRVLYPCLVPEVAETVDAYRMLLVAVAQVADSTGRVRHVVSKMKADDASVAVTVEGALLKVTAGASPLRAAPGGTAQIPVRVARSPKLTGSVRLDLKVPSDLEQWIEVEPVVVPLGHSEATLVLRISADAPALGKRLLRIRASALAAASLPRLADAAGATPLDVEALETLRTGFLPTLAEATIELDLGSGR